MSWATRLAGGHLAPVQDGLSRSVGEAGIEPATSRSRTARAAAALHPDSCGGRRGSRTLKAHRSSVFETVAITRWLALPEMCCVVGRVGIEPTSYGLRDRCNPAFATDPIESFAPPLGVEPRPSVFRTDAQTSYARVGRWGFWRTPSSSTMQLSKMPIETSSSGPRSRTQMSWFRAMRPTIGPVRISGGAARRAHVSRSSRGAGSQWGPRELNPAGLSGRRVYSAPRLPYRSRAPLLCLRRRVAEKQKSHRVRPGGSFALLRSDRQIYASGALPPGPMPPWSTDGRWLYDQAASRPQSRWKLANRAFAASCVGASLFPRRVMMTWFLEDEGIDPRRLTIHYATTTSKSTGNRRRQSRVAS